MQLLARLTHPNIARIYAGACRADVGGSVQELPYYTMEFVHEARTVLAYCADERLDLRARVALFVHVCAAVHHGHQRGIVHRDLKPDNILVTGDGVPKVIDFGIARSTRLAREQLTRAGELVGTVAYLSPEQVLDAQSADVRSDQYALGVVLFELATGQSPYRRTTTLPELLHAIASEEPRRPSELEPRAAGDLEWILLRCLAKDPDARYAGVDDLQAELERFLADRPVLAGPPSLLYRLRKLARRNPGLVVASGIAALSLVVGTSATGVGYARAVEARDDSARQLARRQTAYEFLGGLLRLTGENADPNAKLRDVLASASTRLETEHQDDPELCAELYAAIGSSYHSLALRSSAVEVLERSWRLWQTARGDEDPRTRNALRDYAMASGRIAELYGVERMLEDAERARLAGAHHDWLWNLQQITVIHLSAGRAEEALKTCDAILAGPLALQDDPGMRAYVLRDRGHALSMLTRRAEAVEEMARAEKLFVEVGAPGAAEATRTARAVVLIGMGENDEAAELLEASHAYRVESYGLSSGHTVHVAINLALACAGVNPGRARELCEQVLAHSSELGSDHRYTRTAQRTLAQLLGDSAGELERGIELLLDLQRREQALLPVPHQDLGWTWTTLGGLLGRAERFAESADAFRRANDSFAEVLPEGHPVRCRARAYLLLGRLELDGAQALAGELEGARADREAVAGRPERVHVAAALGALLAELGRDAEAREVLAEVSGLAGTHHVTLAPRVLSALERLGIPAPASR